MDTSVAYLEILFLNDLLQVEAIDKEIYDLAVQKILTIKKSAQPVNIPIIQATA